MTTAEVVSRCPACGNAELARVAGDPPWCPSCEWNLAAWPESKARRRRRRRAAMRHRHEAFALDRSLLEEFRGVRPERPRPTRTGLVLAGVALGLLMFDLAAIAAGAYVLVEGNWAQRILAALLFLVGIECRLRFFKVDPSFGRLTRAEAPQLFRVLDGAADALGAPRVEVLQIDDDYNAWCARSGLRRRVVLSIGLPLWGTLGPAARQALLGHEFGHLVNGDPTTRLVTQPALTTFARLAVILDPKGLIHWGRNPVYDLLGTLIAYPVFWPLCRFCDWAHCRLVRMSARDSRRAETFADALALRLGGTDGAMELMQALLLDRPTLFAVRRSAAQGSADPAMWRDQALAARAELAGELQPREQRSMRYDTSLTASHPPSGLRHRLVRSWPAADPLVPVPVEALAAADRELARRYEQVRRAILNHHLV